MKLVIGERKALNVLTYLVLILMAYFGPNAKLLGNIQLSIWQFQRPIQDIEAYVFKITLLLGVDLLSVIVNAGMLWYFCNINMLKLLMKLQKAFWYVFAIAEAFIVMEVICTLKNLFTVESMISITMFFVSPFQAFVQLCIGTAFDQTLAFDWKDGRYALNDTKLMN